MLTSLAAVLGLLAVGFYTLSVAATGRAGAGEGTALTARTRALVLLLSLGSLGGAYLLYQRPLQPEAAMENAPGSPVTAADLPTRAEQPAESVAADELEQAPTIEPTATPVAEAESLVLDAESMDDPQPERSTAIPPPPREAPEQEQLSSAALALENARQPAPQTAALQPVEQIPAAAATAVSVVKPTVQELPLVAATPRRQTAPPPALAKPAKKTKPRTDEPIRSTPAPPKPAKAMPVMLHVQNTLGPAQTREQLTLSIEGRTVADLAVDLRRPGVEVSVPLPRAGLLHYRLEGVTDDGMGTTLVGEGCIRVQDEARFDVRRHPGSQKVFLEATSQRLTE